MDNRIPVSVIDDRRLFRDAMSARLRRETGIALTAATSRLRDLLEVAKTQSIDIVLVDLSAGTTRGLAIIWDAKSYLPNARVIALGVQTDELTILKCLEAGASGYLTPNASYAALLETIRAVHAGRTPCSPELLVQVMARIRELSHEHKATKVPQHGALSARETEIVQLIAAGLINKQIAQRLGIKLSTVKNHVHNILQKLKVSRRKDTVHRAFELGILKPELADADTSAFPNLSVQSQWN